MDKFIRTNNGAPFSGSGGRIYNPFAKIVFPEFWKIGGNGHLYILNRKTMTTTAAATFAINMIRDVKTEMIKGGHASAAEIKAACERLSSELQISPDMVLDVMTAL